MIYFASHHLQEIWAVQLAIRREAHLGHGVRQEEVLLIKTVGGFRGGGFILSSSGCGAC